MNRQIIDALLANRVKMYANPQSGEFRDLLARDASMLRRLSWAEENEFYCRLYDEILYPVGQPQ